MFVIYDFDDTISGDPVKKLIKQQIYEIEDASTNAGRCLILMFAIFMPRDIQNCSISVERWGKIKDQIKKEI